MTPHTTIQFAGETLLLNPLRSIFWPREEMLVFSDIHLGKAAHFRKHGIAVPAQIMQKDLQRLFELIMYYQPKTITVVGDLFHSGYNSEIREFVQWLQTIPQINWLLVKGNHDKNIIPAHLSFYTTISDNLSLGPITFVHQPGEVTSHCICGHIHPGATLKISPHQKVKLPCFLVSPQHIIMPAFSLFTGLDTEFAGKSHFAFTTYVIAEGNVVKV